MYIEDGIKETGNIDIVHNKKNVFLIGDSIREGYCETVKKELYDIANVVYPNDNCRFTQYVLIRLYDWSKPYQDLNMDLVHFNCGHWDVAHWNGEEESLNDIETYCGNIKRIIKRLKTIFPNAKIIFATTTAMNPNGSIGINPRSNEEICRYNAAVRKILPEDVYINDLYKLTSTYNEDKYADYCHFTKSAFEGLGIEVANYIRKLI